MTRLPLGFAVLVGLAGCSGDSRTPTHPVTGNVRVNGKPAEHASVIFHPLAGTPDTPKPRGKVAADGSFTLTTYDGNDGAPAGKYRVTVELWLADTRSDQPPSNRLPAKFANPDTSGLTAELTDGPNTLQPFELIK